MDKIEKGKYFEIAYKLFRVNPEALDENLEGLSAGDKFDFIAEPEKAFGPYSEEEIFSIPREQMTVNGKFDESMFTPGALIPLMTPDGFRIDGTVVRLTPEAVVLDLNHPLAKDRVHYVGEVITVRDPKPEELQPQEGCGCCGGSCGGGNCGEAGEGSCGCDGGCCH